MLKKEKFKFLFIETTTVTKVSWSQLYENQFYDGENRRRLKQG